MQPEIWDLVQIIASLEAEVAALRVEVVWLTWAFRWLVGLQVSTFSAAFGAAWFSWRNNRIKTQKM